MKQLIILIVLAIFVIGCKNTSIKEERQITLIPKIGSLGKFKVEYFNGHDTISFIPQYKNWKDSIELRCYVYAEEPVNVSEIEQLLEKFGVTQTNIREEIFWLYKLSKARLQKSINDYGDLEGFLAISGGDYIPPKYFEVNASENLIRPTDDIITVKDFPGGSLECSITLNLLNHKIDEYGMEERERDGIWVPSFRKSGRSLIENKSIKGVLPRNGFGVFMKLRVNYILETWERGDDLTFITADNFPFQITYK